MPSGTLVSVVVPSFNDSRFVHQCVTSVLAQSHGPLDVIVVDDGSNDGTAEIARSFGAPVRVFEQPNSGSAVARNRGLREARGEYVAFLDADDCWHSRKIELQLRHLESCAECVAVYCRKLELTERHAAPSWASDQDLAGELAVSSDPGASGWLYLELLRSSVVHTSTVMASRDMLGRVGQFDPTLKKGQDLDYWLRLSRLGPIHMLDDVLSAYRIHASSITHRTMSRNYHAYVVERAVARFGPTDPAGGSLAPGELATILATSWLEFGYQHFRRGSTQICRDSVRRSLRYRSARLRSWSLAVRTALRLLKRDPQASPSTNK